jgi:cytochrome P450
MGSMKPSSLFTDRDEVRQVLTSNAFDPLPKSVDLKPGPTAQLQNSMARFSSSEQHSARRTAVLNEVANLDPAAAHLIARQCTGALLVGKPIEVVSQLALRIPTEVLCSMMNLQHGGLSNFVADLHAVVQVIGHGQRLTNECESAVERLLTICGSTGRVPVPVLSLLYQNYDATASLVINTLTANYQNTPRLAAVRQTLRFARREALIGGIRIKPGEVVALDLESSGLEFGEGPHQCPGRSIAESICDGISDAVAASHYELDFSGADFDATGRPTRLLLRPAASINSAHTS